jgi:hypothetical protein
MLILIMIVHDHLLEVLNYILRYFHDLGNLWYVIHLYFLLNELIQMELMMMMIDQVSM